MISARIVSTGSYLPQKVLTNRDLEHMVETSDEWIVTRTGMSEDASLRMKNLLLIWEQRRRASIRAFGSIF